MNKSEMAKLLGVAAAFDNRNVDEAMVEAWHAAIGDLDLEECTKAVAEHHRTERSWLMPAHVYGLVMEARNNRRAEQDRQAALERRQRLALEGPDPRLQPNLEWLERQKTRNRQPTRAFAGALEALDSMLAAKGIVVPPLVEPDQDFPASSSVVGVGGVEG